MNKNKTLDMDYWFTKEGKLKFDFRCPSLKIITKRIWILLTKKYMRFTLTRETTYELYLYLKKYFED